MFDFCYEKIYFMCSFNKKIEVIICCLTDYQYEKFIDVLKRNRIHIEHEIQITLRYIRIFLEEQIKHISFKINEPYFHLNELRRF